MSDDQSTTTVTRRRVIGTGTLAALAAGLLGTTTAPPVAADPAPAFDLIAALCTGANRLSDERFAEWLDTWHEEYQERTAQHHQLVDRLKDYVPAELHYDIVITLADNAQDLSLLRESRRREEILRHLPGLESVLRLLWEHVDTTKLDAALDCGGGACADGAGIGGPY
jgi:hypothetical protein